MLCLSSSLRQRNQCFRRLYRQNFLLPKRSTSRRRSLGLLVPLPLCRRSSSQKSRHRSRTRTRYRLLSNLRVTRRAGCEPGSVTLARWSTSAAPDLRRQTICATLSAKTASRAWMTTAGASAPKASRVMERTARSLSPLDVAGDLKRCARTARSLDFCGTESAPKATTVKGAASARRIVRRAWVTSARCAQRKPTSVRILARWSAPTIKSRRDSCATSLADLVRPEHTTSAGDRAQVGKSSAAFCASRRVRLARPTWRALARIR